MVEEGAGGGDRASRGRQWGPPRPCAAPKMVGKALWSVERAKKGWCFERAIGVDCSSPEPCCIWLTTLRTDNVDLERRWPRAGAAVTRQKCRSRPCVEKCRMPTPGRRDGASPNANAPLEESFPWVGPKTVVLRKSPQGGFGFTLRHFIVYPPESAVHSNVKEEENGNRAGPQRSRLEPMDTIFVKNVKEDGSAHQAGLRTGDRLVKVNGESIIGKTYSQVIALIQNSDDVLELSIMPKDEDILQLAYSQDAYLKGNEPYAGGAQSIPEPPPVCYPRKTYPFQSRPPHREVMVAEPLQGQQADSRPFRPSSSGPSSPLHSTSLTSPTPSLWNEARSETPREFGSTHSSPAHRTEEIQYGMTQQRAGMPLGRPAPAPGTFLHVSSSSCQGPLAPSLPERYGVPPASSMTNHTCYGVPKHLLEHRTHCGFKDACDTSVVAAGMGRPSWEGSGGTKAVSRLECQQALSNWISNQVPRRSASEDRRYAMPPRYRSISQDRLGDAPAPRGWPHSASQDTLLQPSHDSWACRARSDNYLVRYGRSMEALEQSALVSPRLDQCVWPPEKFYRPNHGQVVQTQPSQPSSYAPSSSSSREAPPMHVQKHPSQPNLQSVDDSGYIGYRSYSPSFQRRTGLLHALSFRDPTFGGLPTFSISQRQGNQPAPYTDRSTPGLSMSLPAAAPPRPDPTSGSGLEIPKDQRSTSHESSARPLEPSPPQGMERLQPEAEEKKEEVILRQKPPTGRKMPPPLRQMNFVFPDDMKETDICDPPVSSKGEMQVAERPARRVAPLAAPEDSLASIPFIDEPTSPSIDLKAKHIPASSVVSSAMNSAPANTTSPSSPAFTFAVSRHYSQDCSSIKASRRSSYLLAITTERSKSCDDGLNTFRDEGKILRRMPSRVPSLRMLRSFFTDGSLDSLGTSEDTRSKRHSTSDLSDVTFSDVRKEGWLHYKQILTKKGKKVGGGIRQWKRVFAVLRAHSLYLCKDRREAVAYAAPQGEEEQPISIRACLVDISYSETKRKHVFRLTTADFCEYLFQAEDRDDMLAWIKVIRENSKAEGEDPSFASQALINKKLNDYRKVNPPGTKPDSSPKGSRGLGIKPEFLKQTGTCAPRSPRQDMAVTKDESGSQKAPWGINIMKKTKKSAPRAFGVRLEDCQPAPDNKNIPLIVEACCKVVEDKGLEYMGIYRVPGNNAMVSSLQEQLNKGATEINLQDERWQDLNVISSLLKSFFRKLPEPLFTDDKYNDFIEANRIEDASERMRTLRKLIRDLPGHYYETLKFLVGHLKTIADHSEKNKMEPRNLALVFGPTLVRTSEDNMTDMVTHMPDRYKIVETLIQHSDWFFSDKEDKGEKTPVDEKEAQSVPNIEYLLPNIGRTAAPGDASDSTNSSSTKSKGSWASRKDQYHKEMLTISFISAVNRKRKKRREAKRFGSSTDDDSEHEATKGAGKARGEEALGAERHGEAEEEEAEELRDHDAPGEVGVEPDARSRVGPEAVCLQQEGHLEVGLAEAEGLKGMKMAVALRSSPEPALDARSIVSGYSTLSTIDRSLCSEVQSVAESRGEEADDERSEFSHVETDTESSFFPGRAGPREGQGDVAGVGVSSDKDRRASFSSRRLIQCDTLARKRLLRPRRDSNSSAKGSAEAPSSSSRGSQESLPPLGAAAEKRGSWASARPSLREQLRLRLRGSADDMLAVPMRQPHSPETRRKKSSWRRHTVVVPGGLKDLNFNEWKEQRVPGQDLADGATSGARGSAEGRPPEASASCKDLHRDNKDSGLSSLESTKARPSSSSLLGNSAPSHQGGAGEQQHSKGTEGNPGDRGPAPKRTASLRFHQCL
ncbi:rho GTPase-activating protein 23 isoform X2 [Alligator mississippiensis]|uniref:rho GTPase-activating protein 23 isoform X2 n=1 Tax=Alligator mississippiensis TaxID=8496 RepID=UPI000907401E|nr:rho GTPase-activating protein 23 isoform X2 [Alligator mississippiensis]